MIGALGAASDVWQAWRGAQANQTSPVTFPQPTAGSAAAPSGQPGANGPVGQLVTDVQSLLVSLQAAGSPASATSTSASGTDPLAAVQSDLQKLQQGPQAGHGHHHRHHGGGAGNVQTDATGGSSNVAAGAALDSGSAGAAPDNGSAGAAPIGGLADAIAKAITAYQATAQTGAASGATA